MTAAFDAMADVYDTVFTHTCLGRWMREVVWETMDPYFHAGMRVLDLGCGTGEDAVWLARRGVHVTAIDASAQMLTRARAKAEQAGVAHFIEWLHLDLSGLIAGTDSPPGIQSPYDGAYANFGVINVVGELRTLGTYLARWIRSDGVLVLVVMGPWCPWEVGVHLLRGRLRTATRRWRRRALAHLGTQTVWVQYFTPRVLGQILAPAFRPVQTVGLGILLPPTDMHPLVDRWPRLFERLARWEARIRHRFPGTWLNDHFIAVFQRR